MGCSLTPYIFLLNCPWSCVGEKPNALAEPCAEEESLTKKGKKKKTVHWAEEEQLKHYFYFDLDETERGKATRLSWLFIHLRHQVVHNHLNNFHLLCYYFT